MIVYCNNRVCITTFYCRSFLQKIFAYKNYIYYMNLYTYWDISNVVLFSLLKWIDFNNAKSFQRSEAILEQLQSRTIPFIHFILFCVLLYNRTIYDISYMICASLYGVLYIIACSQTFKHYAFNYRCNIE